MSGATLTFYERKQSDADARSETQVRRISMGCLALVGLLALDGNNA